MTFHKRSRRWQATGLKNAAFKYLGLYSNEGEAARAVYLDCVSRGLPWTGEVPGQPWTGEVPGQPELPENITEIRAVTQESHQPPSPVDETAPSPTEVPSPVGVGTPSAGTVSDMNSPQKPRHPMVTCTSSRHKKGGFPGVSYHKGTGKWQAAALKPTTKAYIGLFQTEVQAARAVYDEALSRGLVWPFPQIPELVSTLNNAWQPIPRRARWQDKTRGGCSANTKAARRRSVARKRTGSCKQNETLILDDDPVQIPERVPGAIHNGYNSVPVEELDDGDDGDYYCDDEETEEMDYYSGVVEEPADMPGVSRLGNCWRARYGITFLGNFRTEDEACAAVARAHARCEEAIAQWYLGRRAIEAGFSDNAKRAKFDQNPSDGFVEDGGSKARAVEAPVDNGENCSDP